MATSDSKLENFAEELGKLLGTAQAKAEGWLGQRTQIAKTLSGIRDTATKLLTQLGEDTRLVVGRRRGRPPGSGKRGPGRPKGKRTMSAKARKAISDAQKKRWAKQKAAEKK
jgi:hypothetical protein